MVGLVAAACGSGNRPDDEGGDAGTDGGTADAGQPDICQTRGTPPTVIFAAPGAGAVLHGSVAVRVTTTGDCDLTSLVFTVDGVTIATVTTPPWEATWDTSALANANYQLKAVATDRRGQTGEASQNVFVEQACGDGKDCPPRLRLINPAPGSTVCGRLAVGATATDDRDVPSVAFTVDDTPLGTVARSPYFQDWDSSSVADGEHLVGAVASDEAGQTARHTLRVRVDNSHACAPQKPSVAITSPAPDAQGRASCVRGMVALAADARDDGFVREVEYAVDRNLLSGSAPQPPKWQTTWDTAGYEEGPHELKAVAKDNDGLNGQAVLQAQVDRTAPSVNLTSPAAGFFTAGDAVSLAVQVDDGTGCGVAQVEYRLTGPAQETKTTQRPPFGATWDATGKPSGTYTVTATATDRGGNTATDSMQFAVDRPPTLSIVSPTTGETVSGTFSVQVVARAGLFEFDPFPRQGGGPT